MTDKKVLELTEKEKEILEIIQAEFKPEESNHHRVRKLTTIVREHYAGTGKSSAAAALASLIKILLKEKIMREVEKTRLPGEKTQSILYEISKPMLGRREIVVVGRHKPVRTKPVQRKPSDKPTAAGYADLMRRSKEMLVAKRAEHEELKTKINSLKVEIADLEQMIGGVENSVKELAKRLSPSTISES